MVKNPPNISTAKFLSNPLGGLGLSEPSREISTPVSQSKNFTIFLNQRLRKKGRGASTPVSDKSIFSR